MCGEKNIWVVDAITSTGSPPHVRGKGCCNHSMILVDGITPACAGKRPTLPPPVRSAGDHPRMCGEKVFTASGAVQLRGSPPHVRGKDTKLPSQKSSTGITPACAGKRVQALADKLGKQDHPRMCGEKFAAANPALPPSGSPPHVRGKGAYLPFRSPAAGITPACAGKRLKRSRSTVSPVAIVPLFPSVCNKPVVSDGSPAGRDAPLFLPAENAVPASPAYNLRSL